MSEYPYVVSLDPWIDLEAIPTLDALMVDALTAFHADTERRSPLSVDHEPTRVHRLHLARRKAWARPGPIGRSIFHDFANPELWEPRRRRQQEFAPLMEFIDRLPFTHTARILIAYSFEGHGTPLHSDHLDDDLIQEFIWLRTNPTKRFYVCNQSGEVADKRYVESHAAWFDTCGLYQRHASDDVEGLSFSVRIDGVFTPQLRRMIHETTARARERLER